MAAQEYSPQEREVLVALSHERLVRHQLANLLEESATERSEPLGLARLRLRNVEDAARSLQERVALLSRPGEADSQPVSSAEAPLDQVLSGIRTVVAAENAGWQPTIGKNRVVSLRISGQAPKVSPGRVSHGDISEGRVSHGNVGDPKPLSGQHDWPVRGAGPGGGVRVGVIDTALSPHPWLAGGWSARYSDQLSAGDGRAASAGHATFVAGLILRQAPGAMLDVRAVLDSDTGEADSWTAANAIVEMGRSGVQVLNLSFVCFSDDGQPPMAISTAIDRLDTDVVVVAAAGNHGHLPGIEGRRPAWPAALDDVIAVGAGVSAQQVATFTPAGAPWIDVLAPGVDLTSTYLTGSVGGLDSDSSQEFSGLAQWSGSSFATALVSGQIAAGTVPGRVSARESWANILATLTERQPDETPPFLELP